ncbi:PLD nuclease N-terminal domain-containing protein [Streptomyces fradiae]|uniref:PLD nuclease N-terminal domain-containing protein n=1 Tax=Streptomyces fradiae TaxID=1906 RepID=UPI0033FA5745
MLRALMFILPIALTIYAFIDCLNTLEDETKHLPKVAWVFIILLFWIVGPVVWLVAGKTRRSTAGGGAAGPWRREPRPRWVAPDDNPEFLKSLRDGGRDGDGASGGDAKDDALLKDWEADLRRREEELKRRDQDGGGKGDGDPKQP